MQWDMDEHDCSHNNGESIIDDQSIISPSDGM